MKKFSLNLSVIAFVIIGLGNNGHAQKIKRDEIYPFIDNEQLSPPPPKNTEWRVGPQDCLFDLTKKDDRSKFADKLFNEKKYQEAAWVYARGEELTKEKNTLTLLEQELTNGEIASVGPLGGGISETLLVKFSSGIKGVFKPEGEKQYINTEIAVYKIDRLMNINLVPMTVLRVINGKKGSLQYFVKDTKRAVDLGMPIITPKMALFDYLIANRDRHGGNYLIFNDKKMRQHRENYTDQVAIDHNLALIIEKPGIDYNGDPIALAHSGKFFCYQLQQLSEAYLKEQLQNTLSTFQIKMLFKNRKRLLAKECLDYQKTPTCSPN